MSRTGSVRLARTRAGRGPNERVFPVDGHLAFARSAVRRRFTSRLAGERADIEGRVPIDFDQMRHHVVTLISRLDSQEQHRSSCLEIDLGHCLHVHC